MKKAIFFTSVFPFKTVGENFFESELEEAAREFDEIYVVACDEYRRESEILNRLPANVKALSAKTEKKKSSIKNAALVLPFKAFFWREFFSIFKEKSPFFQSFRTLIYVCGRYLSACRNFPKVRGEMNISQDDEIVIVGYWVNYISRIAYEFKKHLGLKNVKVVSRAHGSADVQNVVEPRRFYPFRKYLFTRLDGILAVSDGGCKHLKSISPEPDKISRIYIGSRGSDREIKRSRKPFVVMSCSNLFPLKRVELVGSAVRLLKREIPDIKWVHFGDGPLREKIEKEFVDMEQSIHFYGYTPHDEVLEYLKSGEASVFVSTSATEGLPVSVIEAAAHSLPVVATDVGSTREIAVNGVSGSLIDPDINVTELAREILKYYEMSGEEYDRICSSAFGLWQKEFDCEKNASVFTQAIMPF